MQINKKEFGIRLQQQMEQKNISVKEMAAELNLEDGRSVYKWRNGEALPKLEHLIPLTKKLDITIEELLKAE